MTNEVQANLLQTPAAKLLRIYREAGFQIQTGLNSYHFHGWRDAPFTLLYRDGRLLDTGGGGVSLHEIPVLEHLSLAANFRSIFIVGNSFGWSTLLCALLWPKARVVAVDCGLLHSPDWMQRLLQRTVDLIGGPRPTLNVHPDFGIDLTNELAQKHQLDVRVIKGFSPQDVKKIVVEHLREKPDFVFIDGYHTPEQILLDFAATREVASPDCVYLFHDVINWKLDGSFRQICQTPGMSGTILWRTMSGLGFLFPDKRKLEFQELLRVYEESPDRLQALGSNLRRQMFADQLMRVLLQSRMARGLRRLLGRKG